MKIRVLGCHGSAYLEEGEPRRRECRACGFLVDDTLLVDAGTIGGVLTLTEQKRISQVLLSHLHFDHIQGLPTFADNLHGGDPVDPIVLVSLPEVLKGLQTHIFNGEVYPDFLQLPDPGRPVFRVLPVEPSHELQVGHHRVTAVPVNHTVPAVGFLIDDGVSAILYSGDTHETEEIWKVAARVPTLKAAFIETSFPDGMAEVARVSRHLTPSLLAREFQKLGRPDLPVYVYHLKPRFRKTTIGELGRLGIPNLTVLEEGQEVFV